LLFFIQGQRPDFCFTEFPLWKSGSSALSSKAIAANKDFLPQINTDPQVNPCPILAIKAGLFSRK
jgi:hypothetical protein